MATVSQPLPGRRMWSKTLLWSFLGLMFAYVLYHNESFLLNPRDPNWPHYHDVKWWLLPHGLTAACALLLGPLQFLDKLRQRHLKLHRVLGRVYVGGVLVGAPFGAALQHADEHFINATRSFTMAAVSDAVLLILTTLVGLFFAMRGQIQVHRQWMTRSYAVALVFLEGRLILGLTGLDNNPAAVETVVWMCLIFAVPLADIVLHWQDFRRSKPLAKARGAAA